MYCANSSLFPFSYSLILVPGSISALFRTGKGGGRGVVQNLTIWVLEPEQAILLCSGANDSKIHPLTCGSHGHPSSHQEWRRVPAF